ncbi:unnamed protein product [Paramecium octaurelia]|uniref:Uncharacterized protein n=1 Tax=Paramecium octaurelia TaxID=43137 RepID=A0A8S1UTK6_PAROT|nr:unnamed protein product [Paramecium octaurelia]
MITSARWIKQEKGMQLARIEDGKWVDLSYNFLEYDLSKQQKVAKMQLQQDSTKKIQELDIGNLFLGIKLLNFIWKVSRGGFMRIKLDYIDKFCLITKATSSSLVENSNIVFTCLQFKKEILVSKQLNLVLTHIFYLYSQ